MTNFASAMRYDAAVDLLKGLTGEHAEAVGVVLDGEPEAEELADRLEEAEAVLADLRKLLEGRKTVSVAKVQAVLDQAN